MSIVRSARYKAKWTHFQSLLFHCKEFTNIAEVIFKGSDRRSDIDKAYGKLLQVMFDNIERISYEHEKIPPEIIMFGRCFSFIFHSEPASPVHKLLEISRKVAQNFQKVAQKVANFSKSCPKVAHLLSFFKVICYIIIMNMT